MPKLVVITPKGEERIIEARENTTLMETIRDSGIGDMLALCGGVCSCATCHVHIQGDLWNSLSPMSEDEDALLDSSAHRDARSRLSCQIRLTDQLNGLRVIIAEEG